MNEKIAVKRDRVVEVTGVEERRTRKSTKAWQVTEVEDGDVESDKGVASIAK